MSGRTFAISKVLHKSQLKRKQIENLKEYQGEAVKWMKSLWDVQKRTELAIIFL